MTGLKQVMAAAIEPPTQDAPAAPAEKTGTDEVAEERINDVITLYESAPPQLETSQAPDDPMPTSLRLYCDGLLDIYDLNSVNNIFQKAEFKVRGAPPERRKGRR